MVSFHVFCFYVPPQHFSFEHGAFYHCIFAAVQIEGIRVAGCGGKVRVRVMVLFLNKSPAVLLA